MKNKKLYIITAAIVVCAALALILFGGNRKVGNEVSDEKKETVEADTKKTESKETAVTIISGENLVIQTADVTEEASFYPVNVDGVDMEVIAIRDTEGRVRTAFNTCQICYGSGRGYYVQKGDDLICQNCGNRFKASQVEVQSGGCNPWPIFEDSKTVSDDEITISYDVLKQTQAIFENWKVTY